MRVRTKLKKHQKSFWKVIFSSVSVILVSLFIVHCTRTVASKEYQEPVGMPVATVDQVDQTATDINSIAEASAGKNSIVVNISEQMLYLYAGDNVVVSYPISTSKYGIGSEAGSNKTPLGQHIIVSKIGEGAVEGTIFKSRVNTGKIAVMNAPGAGDLVTTRILWLKGLEPGKNAGGQVDSYNRFIYIHGTAEEKFIGKPASHGCIRMKNTDVVDLFNRVLEDTLVNIIP